MYMLIFTVFGEVSECQGSLILLGCKRTSSVWYKSTARLSDVSTSAYVRQPGGAMVVQIKIFCPVEAAHRHHHCTQ